MQYDVMLVLHTTNLMLKNLQCNRRSKLLRYCLYGQDGQVIGSRNAIVIQHLTNLELVHGP